MEPVMFLKKIFRPPRTLALRLTLWYAGIFTISTLVAFGAFYVAISTVISKNRDRDLMGDVQEYSAMLAAEGVDKVKAEMAWDAQSDGQEHTFLRLLSLDGEEVATTDMSAWRSVDSGSRALEKLKRGADCVLETLDLPEQEFKTRTVYGSIGPNLVLQDRGVIRGRRRILGITPHSIYPSHGYHGDRCHDNRLAHGQTCLEWS